MKEPIVYFTKEISPQSLVKIYEKLNVKLDGKIAVKVHTGEKGNQNYLKPPLYKDLIDKLDGTVVECNTAYDGARNTTEKHLKLIEEHEWTKYFKFDLLDRDGHDLELPVNSNIHLKTNYVGGHFKNYDSVLVLSHFKGHPMGGFGGALKNISIGLASSYGKAVIHGAGNPKMIWKANQDDFIESMAEAAKTVFDYRKNKMVFINIMANMSVDCDCCAKAEDPCMKDIGILASTDPVALDQACIDLVYNSKDPGKDHLIERIESRNGLLILETAEKIKAGSRTYKKIDF